MHYLSNDCILNIANSFRSQIANQKGDKSLKAFQYDEPKALKWLSIKCKRLSNELQAKKFHIGAKSAYFVKSEKFDNSTGQKGTGKCLKLTPKPPN